VTGWQGNLGALYLGSVVLGVGTGVGTGDGSTGRGAGGVIRW
jgi:hypothetical protein